MVLTTAQAKAQSKRRQASRRQSERALSQLPQLAIIRVGDKEFSQLPQLANKKVCGKRQAAGEGLSHDPSASPEE